MTSRHRYVYTLALAAVLAGSVQLRAQEPDSSDPPQPRGWRRVDETQEMERRETLPAASDPAPPQFVLPAGTWITVRVNEQDVLTMPIDKNTTPDLWKTIDVDLTAHAGKEVRLQLCQSGLANFGSGQAYWEAIKILSGATTQPTATAR